MVLLGLVLCASWLIGCSQQEGPAEKAGKKLDETIESVAETMEDAKEDVVDAEYEEVKDEDKKD